MSDQDAHVATEQETALYQALGEGDHDAIEQMRNDAQEADQIEQFNLDYQYAHAHYQADHEAPESEREEATAAAVEAENTEAREMEELAVIEEEIDGEIVDE